MILKWFELKKYVTCMLKHNWFILKCHWHLAVSNSLTYQIQNDNWKRIFSNLFSDSFYFKNTRNVHVKVFYHTKMIPSIYKTISVLTIFVHQECMYMYQFSLSFSKTLVTSKLSNCQLPSSEKTVNQQMTISPPCTVPK